MAYSREQIQKLFQSSFDQSKWTDVIINFFKAREVNRVPEPLDIDAAEGKGYILGYLDTSDTYRISFFYLKLNRSIDQRKVGLRQLIAKYIKIDSDAGIGVFDDGNHWRLSFITDMRGEKTSPKRYTFVFGDSENGYRTAVDRFMELQRKGISFANIKEAFSVEALTKQFYNDLFDWYCWALKPDTGVYFPNNPNTPAADRENLDTKMIRLITRLMFVWFIKQKGLVPDALFNPEEVNYWLKDFDPQSMASANYYLAILQNLFFATLNRPIKTPVYDKEGNQVGEERRGFAHLQGKADVKSLYRYQELFKINEDKILSIFECIPFINGGLFECLDKNKTSDGVENAYYEDGFSRNTTIKDGRWTKRAFVPNKLFFDPEDGIISIFNRYNFTVEENSPSEQQVALDPELLGKVFENLLGVYNPETQDTARSQSGSFYTPREIVNYMVDRSLEAYLGNTDEVKVLFRDDFVYDESKRAFYDQVIAKLKAIKVLDPACGSGAFPMGMLNRIVEVMQNLNAPGNKYDLKLQIMENCIYGGDIQTIAAQITKLRFFISLVCDCKKTDSADDNYGIPNLPNLETHFVTCDSLIGLKKPQEYSLFEQDIIALKAELQKVRHEHFTAKTVYQKTKLRDRDKQLRDELARMLSDDNVIASEDAKQMAAWNPYDQNGKSPFFDPEWMFGIKDGFDVVIGNPPYVLLQNSSIPQAIQEEYLHNYKCAQYKVDLYHLFIELACNLTKRNGIACLITPISFYKNEHNEKLRKILIERTELLTVVRFFISLFDEASVDNAITLFKTSNKKNDKIIIKDIKSSVQDIYNSNFFTFDQKSIIGPNYFFEFDKKENNNPIISKIEKNSPLSFFASAYFGIQTFDRKRYVSEIPLNDNYKPVVDGVNVMPYYLSPNKEYVDYRKEAIKSGGSYAIYCQDRILVRQIGEFPFGCLCPKNVFTLNTIYNIHLINERIELKYLLAILNSSVIKYYWKIKFSDSKKTFPKIKKRPLESIPIVYAQPNDRQKIITIVDSLLLKKGNDPRYDMSKELKDIDKIVFELYGLSPDEQQEVVKG